MPQPGQRSRRDSRSHHVIAQYTYDAYGNVLTAAHFSGMSPLAYLHCGHKGLFLDRMEVGVATTGYAENPRLAPFSQPLVQNRNRAYSPMLGRFLQQDPNETGAALLASARHNGRGARAIALAFSLDGHYGDGLNAYEYLGSNPWQRSDVLGLSWDPFDLVDEFTSSRAASASALLSEVGSAMRAAAMVAATIAAELPFPMVGFLGELGKAILNGDDIGSSSARKRWASSWAACRAGNCSCGSAASPWTSSRPTATPRSLKRI